MRFTKEEVPFGQWGCTNWGRQEWWFAAILSGIALVVVSTVVFLIWHEVRTNVMKEEGCEVIDTRQQTMLICTNAGDVSVCNPMQTTEELLECPDGRREWR